MSDPSHRITLGGETFLCGRPPQAVEDEGPTGAGEVSERLERAWRTRPASQAAPTLLYWDGMAGGVRVRLGAGGLDEYLASEYDFGGCCAVQESVMRRLVERGGLRDVAEIGRAAALLARDPSNHPLYCDGVIGRLAAKPEPMLDRRPGAATHADYLSIVVLVNGPEAALEKALEAVEGQAIATRAEVLVIASGLDNAGQARLIQLTDARRTANSKLRIKRYPLSGDFSPAHLVEVGAALALGDVIVVFDPRCRPSSPSTLQRLADWASGGDVASASPRIEWSGRLAAAGLAVSQGPEPGLRLGSEEMFGRSTRLVAAPNPWLFAANRAAFLKAQGLRAAAGSPLWTAAFAAANGPRGRNLLIGSEAAEWVGETPPPVEATEPLPGPLSASAARALRASPQAPAALAPAPKPAAAPPLPKAAPAAEPSGPPAAFSDPFPSPAGLRILVFADLYGASQSIAFVNGLSGPRARGEVAVRLVEESIFPGSSQSLTEVSADAMVEPHFAAVRPNLVVVSRLGHAAGYRAVAKAARRRGIPLVFHVDDDLFDLPVTLGIERYRLARNPKRLHTLHRALEESDLTLTTTPALAERLEALAGHSRIGALRYGTAGIPSGGPRGEAGRVVVGYMGSASHDHDLEMIAPALNAVAARHPEVEIELFGSIAGQPAAKLLTGPVKTHKAVLRDYAGFRTRLGELGWSLGLAPLADVPFNRAKTPTKWVEYAQAGIATVVSDIAVYRPMIEAGAALPAGPDQWETALTRAVRDVSLRRATVAAADGLLGREFSWIQLEQELMALLSRAAKTAVAA